MKDSREDRLYELLPAIYRIQDAERGEPLKALLRVIASQVNLVEDDIRQLYENWFIETCEDWVVPYIGDLVGYEPVHEAGEPSGIEAEQERMRNNILIPRREVANTVRYRRRKGTLALLELLANDVADWPARAVEFFPLLGWTQSLNHQRLDRGKTADIRNETWLKRIGTPFEKLAHTIELRRINSLLSQGRYNIPSVGVFVWRLKSFSVTKTPACCQEAAGPQCFTFSVLCNDAPLYMHPEPETDPTHIADEYNLPVPITRHLLQEQTERLYGSGKNLRLWRGKRRGKNISMEPVPPDKIIVADLSHWRYQPRRGKVAVDPELGRIAFPAGQLPKHGVWVSYHYGFSMNIGGGEYERTLSQPKEYALYKVGKSDTFETIGAALKQWREDNEPHAVIEITDSGVYVEPLQIDFSNSAPDENKRESLQLRAANRKRPVIRLLDWETSKTDSMAIVGSGKSCVTIDGLLIAGRGVQVSGELSELYIRHSTLVPGWSLGADCGPLRTTEPSLEIFSADVCINIESSILGTIQIDPAAAIIETESSEDMEENDNERESSSEIAMARCRGIIEQVRLDPIRVCISDSILDATHPTLEALGAPGCPVAHAILNIERSTVIGQIQAHAIELGENTIFNGRITVAKRQTGCMRFCSVTPDSRTPRRYRCQPDLAEKPVLEDFADNLIFEEEKNRKLETERLRVRPIFNSIRYGAPTYCQLSNWCADEIKTGADDESEMGVFHDLYEPQRMANLKVRLEEYTPAGMDVGIIKSN